MDSRTIVERVMAAGLEPGVRYCGTPGCLHTGAQHSLANRCLVCDCDYFSSRSDFDDVTTALRLAEVTTPQRVATAKPFPALKRGAKACACGCGRMTKGGTFLRGHSNRPKAKASGV